jgi:hypothetical protein
LMLTTTDANADSVPSDEFQSNCSEAAGNDLTSKVQKFERSEGISRYCSEI